MNPARIQRAVRLLAEAQHATALTGAGVSTPSGVPDFRSPHSGLWNRVNPVAVASIWGFKRNPQAFYDWIVSLAEPVLRAEPNPAHRALAKLEQMGKLKAVITQNVDGLHQRAGSQRVLELHGHFREATCMKCHKRIPAAGALEKLLQDRTVPRCPACGGVLKPAAVLFGEPLPYDVVMEAQNESRASDVMLIAGSSLEVTPACDLPRIAHQAGARLLIINYDPTPLDRLADTVIHDDVAVVLPAIVSQLRQITD